jgi:stearoyl-CoA desaturase (Delta-9 desaturase)
MLSVLIALIVFVAAYFLIIVTTSVGYHRGLAHGAVKLRDPVRRMLLAGGVWLTAIDPKTWVVMHRLHHAHSDDVDDPHSPRNARARTALGRFFGMFVQQLVGYDHVAERLRANDPHYTSLGRDLGEMSWPMRTNRILLVIGLHVALGVIVGVLAGWLIGVALFAGLMSHVVQGAIINYFGHAHGRRNFALDDNSRNNHAAAWLVLGEGFQNNHHRYPSSARFALRRREIDLGYVVCLLLERLRVLDINRATLAPRFAG